MDQHSNIKDRLRVKKNLFQTTTSPDGRVKVESLSSDIFYGKSVGRLRVYSEVNDCAPKSHKTSPKKYKEPAAQRPSRPKEEASKSKQAERPHRTNDVLPDDFIAKFVSAMCDEE